MRGYVDRGSNYPWEVKVVGQSCQAVNQITGETRPAHAVRDNVSFEDAHMAATADCEEACGKLVAA